MESDIRDLILERKAEVKKAELLFSAAQQAVDKDEEASFTRLLTSMMEWIEAQDHLIAAYDAHIEDVENTVQSIITRQQELKDAAKHLKIPQREAPKEEPKVKEEEVIKILSKNPQYLSTLRKMFPQKQLDAILAKIYKRVEMVKEGNDMLVKMKG